MSERSKRDSRSVEMGNVGRGTRVGSSRREGARNKDGVRDRLEATRRDTTHAHAHLHGRVSVSVCRGTKKRAGREIGIEIGR